MFELGKVPLGIACSAIAMLLLCGLAAEADTPKETPPARQRPSTADEQAPSSDHMPPPSGSETPASAKLDEKCARFQRTKNWSFITPSFLETIARRQSSLQGIAITVLGNVSDENDQPVQDALVVLRLFSNLGNQRVIDGKTQEVFAVAWTDPTGAFKFLEQPTPWCEPACPINWELCVFSPGHAMAIRRYRNMDDRLRVESIQLRPEHVVELTVKDAAGNPQSGFECAAVEIINPYENASIENSLLRSEMLSFVAADPQGKIRMGGLPPERIVTVVPRNQRLGAEGVIRIATSRNLQREKMIAKDGPGSDRIYPYLEPTCEVVAEQVARPGPKGRVVGRAVDNTRATPQRTVTVRVVSAKDGKPVPGVAVGSRLDIQEPSISPGMIVTDKNGVAKIEIPQRAMDVVYIGGRCFGFVTPYERITTSLEEYTPQVERDYWTKSISAEQSELDVTFKLQPVEPLKVNVIRKSDGAPVKAWLRVMRHGWEDSYQMPETRTDDQGQATIAIRPVMFDIDIVAKSADGMQGTASAQLSKDFDKEEQVTIVVD